MSAKAVLRIKQDGRWVAVPIILGESEDIGFTTDKTLTLNPATRVLSVNTATKVEKDNTLPVTSAAVHVEVGNITALLETI